MVNIDLVNQATDASLDILCCVILRLSHVVIEKTDDLPLIIRRHNIINRDISPSTREWYEEENRTVSSKKKYIVMDATFKWKKKINSHCSYAIFFYVGNLAWINRTWLTNQTTTKTLSSKFHDVIINDLKLTDLYSFMSGSFADLANHLSAMGISP